MVHNLDPVTGGGTAERTFQMTRYLTRAGVGCVVLTTDVGVTPERLKALSGAEVIALPYLIKRFFVPRALGRIRKAVESADVIHLMGHWTAINALVYFYARRLGRPYVICPAGSLAIFGRSRYLKLLFKWLLGERIVRDASGHIAITADEIPHFEVYGVAPDQVTVIPNGIERTGLMAKDDAALREKYGLGDRPFVLFVGRLSPEKGPDLLLRAFCEAGERLGDHLLVLAGPDWGMLPELRRTVAELGVEDRVSFPGYLEGDDKSRAYHAAELLVIPSRREAMSIVVLEAGITGTPVLLTDRCGFGEVAQARGGLVVPASVEGLRDGLVAMLADAGELRAMGARLRELTESRFSWSSVVARYIELYEDILKKAHRVESAG